MRRRIAIALLVGLAAAAFNWATKVHLGRATDFQQLVAAARALLAGADPYGVVGPGMVYDWPWRLLYPLPAVLIAAPFSAEAFPFGVGAMCFVFVGAASFTFAITHDGLHRVPLLMSVPALWAFWWAQWSPILAAATVLPFLGFVYAAKPTIGIALFAYRPRISALLGIILIVGVSFLAHPDWLAGWLGAVSHSDTGHFLIPIRWPGGALVLLALLRWRRPEARLLIAMSLVPQSPTFYDYLPLAFIPGTYRESVTLTVLTYAVMTLTVVGAPGYELTQNLPISASTSVLLVYLPCLIMILRRPNEGTLPRWLLRRIPALAPVGGPSMGASAIGGRSAADH
jgi:hypothetical protein